MPPDKAPLELEAMRKALGLNQTEMAHMMGLGMRTYQKLEADPKSIAKRHNLLAEYAALRVAYEKSDPMLAPPHVRKMALDLARMITG